MEKGDKDVSCTVYMITDPESNLLARGLFPGPVHYTFGGNTKPRLPGGRSFRDTRI